jgi:hypothetical protein
MKYSDRSSSASHRHHIMKLILMGIFVSALLGCAATETVTDTVTDTVGMTAKTIKDTSRKITHEIKTIGGHLKKTILILPFENKSLDRTRDYQALFQNGLVEYLNNECEDLIVTNADPNMQTDQLTEVPRLPSGRPDNYALAIFGRHMGLNAVVTGTLTDISVVEQIRGVVWNYSRYVVRVVVRVEAFDTHTATKVFDNIYIRTIEVDEMDYELNQAGQKLNLPELSQTLNKLLADIGLDTCFAVSEQLWNTYISSIAGDTVIVSAGSKAGLKPGEKLDVFKAGRIIEGIEGQRFITDGPKTAQLEIVSVLDSTAEAVLVSGDSIEVGNTVKLED